MDGHRQRKRIERTEGRSNGRETDQRGNDDDLARLLPDDVLVEVLRRLPPRWLAASRCACKAWRDVVDARRLLRADLLPLWLDGLVVYFSKHENSPEFLTRPSLPASAKLENLTATDVCGCHRNGLVLSYDYDTDCLYVANPAIGWKVFLPPTPSPCVAVEMVSWSEYLVFDPTVSNHYEVIVVPSLTCNPKPYAPGPVSETSEWPPPQLVMHVLSSTTGRWEARTFSREGEAAGTIADTRSKFQQRYCHIRLAGSAYWRQALYVHSGADFITRISSSGSTCRVIKQPSGIEVNEEYSAKLYLARSEKGVYFASHCNLQIRVWILDESCGHFVWVLKHDINLELVLPRCPQVNGPWVLQSVKGHPGVADVVHDSHEAISESDEKFRWNCPLQKDNFDWNSDGDDVLVQEDRYRFQADNSDANQALFQADDVVLLGFHPYKEIIFLSQSSQIGLAYHLNSSRVQVLGSLSPANGGALVEDEDYENGYISSMPYTPCWIEELPGNN